MCICKRDLYNLIHYALSSVEGIQRVGRHIITRLESNALQLDIEM